MRLTVGLLIAVLLTGIACGPLKSREAAISDAKSTVGAMQVSRSDAKQMTWKEWQQRSGNHGGAIPAPAGSSKVWVVALQGHFTKFNLNGASATIVILDPNTGKLIVGETGDWDWPPFWDSL